MKFSVAILFAAALISFESGVRADSILNGSFEQLPIASGAQLSPVSSSDIPGWTVIGPSGSNVQLFNSLYQESGTINGGPYNITFNSHSGSQWIDVSGTSNMAGSGVQQTVATTDGQLYSLSFYVGRADEFLDTVAGSVNLSINGGPAQLFQNTNISANHINWQQFSVLFTGSGTSTTLSFTYGGNAPPDYVAGLDDVSLNAVAPLPSTFAMSSSLLGLIGAIWSARRLGRKLV